MDWIMFWVLVGGLSALVVGLVVLTVIIEKDKHKQIKAFRDKMAKTDEYRALLQQIEDLGKLRDNLDAQVELDKKYLNEAATVKAVAEVQIKSANTQFKDIQDKVRELEKLLQERKGGVDGEIEKYRVEVRTRVDAELAAAAETKRREATEALVKELEELRRQADEKRTDQVALTEELTKLLEEKKVLNAEVEGLAVTHAEAVKRVALESGTGGHVELGQADRDDAALMRKMCKGMRCENAVLKATYDVYVKPEIERLVRDQGVAGVSGIYRIWKKDGEKELSYIGQAVDVGERWKTHAKRAWGVDNTGRIKLYQTMMESGIEQWNWELVENCEVAVLSEREKYWGLFYATKEVGLNSKLG